MNFLTPIIDKIKSLPSGDAEVEMSTGVIGWDDYMFKKLSYPKHKETLISRHVLNTPICEEVMLEFSNTKKMNFEEMFEDIKENVNYTKECEGRIRSQKKYLCLARGSDSSLVPLKSKKEKIPGLIFVLLLVTFDSLAESGISTIRIALREYSSSKSPHVTKYLESNKEVIKDTHFSQVVLNGKNLFGHLRADNYIDDIDLLRNDFSKIVEVGAKVSALDFYYKFMESEIGFSETFDYFLSNRLAKYPKAKFYYQLFLISMKETNRNFTLTRFLFQ